MENIKLNDRVKYSGEANRWTFHEDLVKDCLGTVIGFFDTNDKIDYQVRFDNGITSAIESSDLILFN